MRLWVKIGIGVLIMGLMLSLVALAKYALATTTNLSADSASTLAAWTADNKTKSGNKGRQGKSGSAKDKPRKRTKNAGQRARTDTSDKYLTHGAGPKPTGALLWS